MMQGTEDQAFELVRSMRACESLEELADVVVESQKSNGEVSSGRQTEGDSPESQGSTWMEDEGMSASLEAELSGKIGALRLEDGQVGVRGSMVGGLANALVDALHWGHVESDIDTIGKGSAEGTTVQGPYASRKPSYHFLDECDGRCRADASSDDNVLHLPLSVLHDAVEGSVQQAVYGGKAGR